LHRDGKSTAVAKLPEDESKYEYCPAILEYEYEYGIVVLGYGFKYRAPGFESSDLPSQNVPVSTFLSLSN
jgi:hypothetical protein